MQILKKVLETKKEGLLNIYCTAGYPELNDLPTIVNALHDAGVDMVEIGIPYSDPIADGETIQQSNAVALKNGITIDLIFEQIEKCYKDIPKIVMTYFNPVFKYGLEHFCEQCQKVGVDGLIIPDLPLDLYQSMCEKLFKKYGLSSIFLITPQTSPERLKYIDDLSSTFIYAVSSSSTTGKISGINTSDRYLSGLKDLGLKHPILVGFNISTSEDLALVNQYAQGGIIGSAFIKHLRKNSLLEEACHTFVRQTLKD
tara:strand:- start:2964 stop:3731 length:768 start_codon:yes stop_codon:yes gene_type:complete